MNRALSLALLIFALVGLLAPYVVIGEDCERGNNIYCFENADCCPGGKCEGYEPLIDVKKCAYPDHHVTTTVGVTPDF